MVEGARAFAAETLQAVNETLNALRPGRAPMAKRGVLPLTAASMALPGKAGLLLQRPALIIAVFALVGVIFLAMAVTTGRPSFPPGGNQVYPGLDCDPACNRPAGTGPRPANEVTIAINPTDDRNIVAAANDYGTPNSDAWVGFYTTHDGGKSWNRSLVPGYRPSASPFPLPCGGGLLPGQGICGFEGAGDPVLAVDSEGNFYLAGIAFKRSQITVGQTSAIFVAKSTDGGDTFPDVTVLATAISKVSFHDKEWIAVDPVGGNVYVTWTLFNLFAISQILESHSTNGGQSWTTPKVISETGVRSLSDDTQGSQVEVDNNGTVHVAWIDYTAPEAMKYSSSRDGGSSYSAPRAIAPVTPIASPQGNTTYRTPTMPDMAIDLTNGTYNGSIYIWWPDESNGDADIFQVFSRDGGATWSNVSRVNNDEQGNGKSQFFPAVSVAGNGWVVGEWYDRRLDPNNKLLSVFVGISMDGGQTYDFQFNWTDAMLDGDKSAGASGVGFIGDYLGIASSDWYAVGVWCDMRNFDAGNGTDIYAGKLLLSPPPS